MSRDRAPQRDRRRPRHTDRPKSPVSCWSSGNTRESCSASFKRRLAFGVGSQASECVFRISMQRSHCSPIVIVSEGLCRLAVDSDIAYIDRFYCHRGHETIAAPSDRGEKPAAVVPVSQCTPDTAYLDFEIALVDEGSWPHSRHKFTLGNQKARPLDKRHQNFQRAATDPYGCSVPQQQLLRRQQLKRAEPKGLFPQ